MNVKKKRRNQMKIIEQEERENLEEAVKHIQDRKHIVS